MLLIENVANSLCFTIRQRRATFRRSSDDGGNCLRNLENASREQRRRRNAYLKRFGLHFGPILAPKTSPGGSKKPACKASEICTDFGTQKYFWGRQKGGVRRRSDSARYVNNIVFTRFYIFASAAADLFWHPFGHPLGSLWGCFRGPKWCPDGAL